jgi:predicted branched-subunit amino acid permease
VVLTVAVINLRMMMYGASLAPHLTDLSLRRRVLGAYVLTDQSYAVSIVRFRDPAGPDERWRFYLGAGLALWLPWQLATVTGAAVGSTVPDAVPLAYSVPLMFLALLVPAVVDRPTLFAAVVSAGVATAGAGLPANLGMLLGATTGIAVGWWAAMASRPR